MKISICDCCKKQIGRKYSIEHCLSLQVKSTSEWIEHPDTIQKEVIDASFDICEECVLKHIIPLFDLDAEEKDK